MWEAWIDFLEKLNQIWQWYQPVQPDWTAHEGVTYDEVKPHPVLRHAIACYWKLEATPSAEPVTYRVIADGCIDVFFDLQDPASAFVMGFCDAYTTFPLATPFRYVGVRFLPTMFPLFYRTPAGTLTGRVEPLADVAPQTAGFIRAHIAPTHDFDSIRRLLDQHFCERYARLVWQPDNRLYHALERIIRTPDLRVETDLGTGVSPRQLRRLFENHVGDSAKTFARVVRFQQFVRAGLVREESFKESDFFDYGYYDQAHFIKEFRRLYGRTPSRTR